MGGGLMLVFWIALIVGIVLLVRWVLDRDAQPRRPTALEILQQRLAKGEIEPEDYEARRKLLESGDR